MRQKIVDGYELGRKICEALDIDPRGVTGIRIDCIMGEPAIVEVERYVPGDKGEAMVEELKRYRLMDPS